MNKWMKIRLIVILSLVTFLSGLGAAAAQCYVGGRPCYPNWMMPRYCGWYGVCRNWVGRGPWGYSVPGYYPAWGWRW